MENARVALLNAAHNSEDSSRNFHRELDADLEEFHCPAGEFPGSFEYDGFVVTGSRASVYWDEPWIGKLKAWAGDAIEVGLPALGVCYGHQLLADVMGGRVEGMGEYELGYRTVEQDGENRLLEGIDTEITVFTSHSDRVVEPPPGATIFAKNDYGIHGFRKGHTFGVQFHPEYDMRTAQRVTKGKDDQLSADRIESVLEGIDEPNYRAACEAKRLFDNFLGYVEEVRASRIGAD